MNNETYKGTRSGKTASDELINYLCEQLKHVYLLYNIGWSLFPAIYLIFFAPNLFPRAIRDVIINPNSMFSWAILSAYTIASAVFIVAPLKMSRAFIDRKFCSYIRKRNFTFDITTVSDIAYSHSRHSSHGYHYPVVNGLVIHDHGMESYERGQPCCVIFIQHRKHKSLYTIVPYEDLSISKQSQQSGSLELEASKPVISHIETDSPKYKPLEQLALGRLNQYRASKQVYEGLSKESQKSLKILAIIAVVVFGGIILVLRIVSLCT